LKAAEEAVWKHYKVQEKLKEIQVSPQSKKFQFPNKVRLLQLGPDHGEPVLLIHGGGGAPTDFAALLPSLLSNKYRILLLERPGSGSADPYDFSETVVDEFYANLVASVLKELNIDGKIHLVGNSMGGCIMVWFAKRFPETIKSFSFVGVPVCFTGMKVPFVFHVLASWFGKQMMARPPPRSLTEDLFESHFHTDMEILPDVSIDYLWTSMKTRNNSLSWQSLLNRVMPSWFGLSSSPFEWKLESLPELSKQFPCQFLVGSQDTDMMTLEQQQLVEEYFGGNRYVVGQGHLPWVEDSEGVAKRLVDFWK
jgi:pimeloyl-ACP methyl ester carboxylesterase